jgi:hypothetical protein
MIAAIIFINGIVMKIEKEYLNWSFMVFISVYAAIF